VYQAGTLSGNPLSMAAGIATLQALSAPGFYEALEAKAKRMAHGIQAAMRSVETPVSLNRVGSLMTLFFGAGPIHDYASAKTCDTQRYAAYFHSLLDSGVYFPPAQFEAAFVSAAHSDADIDATVEAIETALKQS
jgi:glutamate-1-semialdehyde 2,1-aminomutase